MRKVFHLLSLYLLSQSPTVFADPWFTGPILAPGGITIPKGHTNFEMYTFYTLDTGNYNNKSHWIHTRSDNSKVLNPVFSHGISDRMDIQYSVPYIFNSAQGMRRRDFGDPAVTLGYQVFTQGNSKWRPNLRFTVQEIIPLGGFTQLDPALNGTDSTGLGSYQTAVGLNFQHILRFSDIHYLRTRFAVNYVLASVADIQGFSIYGGTRETNGRINPGSMWTLDLAGEFTMTQNVNLVMEGFYAHRQATNFRGIIGFNSDNTPGTIGRRAMSIYTLAPAIEYNFTQKIGLLTGTWITLAGKNATHFNTYVVALNMYF